MDEAPASGRLSAIAPHTDQGLFIWNCTSCRRRKVRCDRQYPCSHCQKSGTDCVFPASGRLPTRKRDLNAEQSSKQRQIELLTRLRRLESVVKDFEAHHGEHTASRPTAGGVNTARSDPPSDSSCLGKMVPHRDQNLYVSSGFWASMMDEVRPFGANSHFEVSPSSV
jgi:hypothetical protein